MTGLELLAAAILTALDELPQDPDRPALAAADLKALRETNIFSPHKVKRVESRPSRSSDRREPEAPPPPPARPKPPVVTGIFLDQKSGLYTVVVEDRNSESLKVFKEPKFLKAGDEVSSCRIDAVDMTAVMVSLGGESKELRIGDPLPEAAAPAPGGPEKTDAKPAESKPAEAKPAEVKAEDPELEKTKQMLKERLKGRKKGRELDTPE